MEESKNNMMILSIVAIVGIVAISFGFSMASKNSAVMPSAVMVEKKMMQGSDNLAGKAYGCSPTEHEGRTYCTNNIGEANCESGQTAHCMDNSACGGGLYWSCSGGGVEALYGTY